LLLFFWVFILLLRLIYNSIDINIFLLYTIFGTLKSKGGSIMAKDRTGKFWWEYQSYRFITLESMGGVYDKTLSSDCRCGISCDICEFRNICAGRSSLPWAAIGSIENWGDDILTPQGLPDGDMPHLDFDFIPIEHEFVCSIDGSILDSETQEDDIIDRLFAQAFENPEVFRDDRYNPKFVYQYNGPYFLQQEEGQETYCDELPLREKMSFSLKPASRKMTRRLCCSSCQNGKRGDSKYKVHPHKKIRGEHYMASVEDLPVEMSL